MEPVCHVENSCRLGDGFCDDFLNTPNCGFDQGDCCGNENPGWNSYCHVKILSIFESFYKNNNFLGMQMS